MKLWLDAKRVPDYDWVWATTPACAIVLLRGGCVDKISFAPDQKKIVSPVVEWMIKNDIHPERQVHRRTEGKRKPPSLVRLVMRAAML